MLEVEKNSERCIFLIENCGLKYYIVIPRAAEVNLLLGLIDDVNEQKIKNVPILKDKAVVVPVVNERIINYLATPNQSYKDALVYFSSLINNSYTLLARNNIKVNPVVLFNNVERFGSFVEYFVGTASGRVQKTDVDLLVKVEKDDSMLKVENDVPVNIPVDVPVDVLGDNDFKDENLEQVQPKGEPGFVSYVLLGVVIAVLSLVFLYMLI